MCHLRTRAPHSRYCKAETVSAELFAEALKQFVAEDLGLGYTYVFRELTPEACAAVIKLLDRDGDKSVRLPFSSGLLWVVVASL